MPLFSLVPLFGWALTLAALTKNKPTGLLLCSALACMALTTYVGGLAGALHPTAHIVWFGGAGLFCFWIVQACRGKGYARLFFSQPWPWIYTLLCGLYWIVFQDCELLYWDEFSHWALAPKEMYFRRALYAANENLTHAHYPPGAALWHTIVTVHAGFTPGTLYMGQFMMLCAPFMAFLQKIHWRQAHWMVIGLALSLLLVADLGQGVAMLLVDALLGAWFGGMLLYFLSGECNLPEMLLLAPPLIFIALLKDLGLVLSLSAATLFLLTHLITRGQLPAGAKKGRLVLASCALFLLPLLFYGSWSLYLQGQDPGAQQRQARESTLERAWKLFSRNKEQSYRSIAMQRFQKVFLHQQQSRTALNYELNEFNYQHFNEFTDAWRMSAAGWGGMCLALLLLRFSLARRKTRQKKELLLWTCYLGLFFAFYVALLMGLYLFIFDEHQALGLVSYVRYCNIVLLPLAMVGAGLFFPLYAAGEDAPGPRSWRDRLVPFLGILITLGLYTAEPPHLKPLYQPHKLDYFRRDIQWIINLVRNNLGEHDRLYVLFPVKSNGIFQVILNYELAPVRSTISPADVLHWPLKKLTTTVSGYDYVLLLFPEKELLRYLPSTLVEQPLQSPLFHVAHTPQGVRLQPLILGIDRGLPGKNTRSPAPPAD